MNASMRDQYVEKFLELAMSGDFDMLKKTLNGIADINVTNDRGWTALMFAARNGHDDIIRVLLENKADPNVFNSAGQNALEIAKFWNNKGAIELLNNESQTSKQLSLYESTHFEAVNFFGATTLDRAAEKRKDSQWLEKSMMHKNTNYILLSKLNAVAVAQPDNSIKNQKTPSFKLCIAGYDDIKTFLDSKPLTLYLGEEMIKNIKNPDLEDSKTYEQSSRSWFCIDATDMTQEAFERIHPQAELLDVYPGAMNLTADHAAIYAQARSLMAWHDRYSFCSTCGAKTTVTEAGHKRQCTNTECRSLKGVHNTSYPRVDPTTIMAVVSPDNKSLLLGRGSKFPRGMYSCLAGFIETGETIEAACRREVAEESGIEVGKVEYHSSQPWPMPSSLMIGCFAYATSSKIKVDKDELEDARWFSRIEVVQMLTHKHPERLFCPPEQAIAHQLIKTWVNMTSNL